MTWERCLANELMTLWTAMAALIRPERITPLPLPPNRWFAARMIALGCLLVAADTRAEDAATAPEPATPHSVYGEGVRPTNWLAAEDQRKQFHLPPGFEVRLFASEPQIAKPLNMACDDRGRVWITQSTAYPYPRKSEDAVGEDAVMVLEDSDGDGHAERITRFADNLNIPIGVLPYGDGCLCFSIPNLWYLRDTDGDGRCDRREIVLGPFDWSRDTHGLVNALRDGGDGWIYACHGFSNQSRVAGHDGHVVELTSGNTFRFRPDGSRVELVTRGQVNPFGMAEDSWGYRFSADCHSKPITQLISGGCYPSFGRPHDGLGFLPPMMDHLHGSTAISGIVYVPEDSPLAPLRGQFVSGNVMTSRLNRTRLAYDGATARGTPLPDFLTSEDPWFRPVDLMLDGSGNLLVADFYNKIIGHYEVPLEHPGRDRTSGRLWQIRYAPHTPPVPSADSVAKHAARLSQDDRGSPDVPTANAWQAASPRQRLAWIRLAPQRWSADDPPGRESLVRLIRDGLADPNVHVARAAAELAGQSGMAEVMHQLTEVESSDPVMRQTLRIALHRILLAADESAPAWSLFSDGLLADPQHPRADDFASILLADTRPIAAQTLLAFVQKFQGLPRTEAYMQHVIRHAKPSDVERALRVVRQRTGNSVNEQLRWLERLSANAAASPEAREPLVEWATDVITKVVSSLQPTSSSAPSMLLSWSEASGKPWPSQQRPISSSAEVPLSSSGALGESYTGRYRSGSFPAPPRISFWLAGHNGVPNESSHEKNSVCLVSSVDQQVLRRAMPPRSDRAIHVQWDLAELAGTEVRIEAIDADDQHAYAWLALGAFDPPWLGSVQGVEQLRLGIALVRRLKIDSLDGQLQRLLERGGMSSDLSLEIVSALKVVRQSPVRRALISSLIQSDLTSEVKLRYGTALSASDDPMLGSLIAEMAREFSHSQQSQLALDWIREGGDLSLLLDLCDQGTLSPTALQRDDVRQTLDAKFSPQQKTRWDQLSEDWPAADQKLIAALQQLRTTTAELTPNRKHGQSLFQKHCATCHQMRGTGATLAPQLDGAAARSPQRLLEDIVTPSRNVDKAFRTTSLLVDDGRVWVGVIQSEEGGIIRLVDGGGKIIELDSESVENRRASQLSLMPSNFSELLSPQDFSDLLGFLRNVGTP